MRIIAFDPSLTGFGVAGPALHAVETIAPPKGMDRGGRRLQFFRDAIERTLYPLGPGYSAPDLVVIEGYSFASSASQAHRLGELGGVVRLALEDAAISYVEVPPSNRMQYATGKGQAAKEAVLAEAIRRLGYEGSSSDEADAMWILAMALDAYGLPGAVDMPKAHRAALEAVPWPREVLVGGLAPIWARVPYVPKKKRKKKGAK